MAVTLPGKGDVHIDFETVNQPVVMGPYEVRENFVFLLGECVPHAALGVVQQGLLDFSRRWQALWAAFGESPAGLPRYQQLIARGQAEAQRRGAGQVVLRNGVNLLQMLDRYVFGVALAAAVDAAAQQDVHGATGASAPARAAPVRAGAAGARLERPVFIVSAPRSGSTLLFETLSAAPAVFTVGGESHQLIEGISRLAPGHDGLDSNRLDAGFASPDVVAELQQRFLDALSDRDGRRPEGAVRLLEKTPKNALRIPFLKAAFPGARFIYLHRDPRQVLASMIEGWKSGRFVTYPRLPGWEGLPWSFLLTPGWQALSGKPLADVVAGQWETTTRLLVDDLQALDPADWTAVRFADFVADPRATVQRLAAWAGWDFDRELGPVLPPSRSTLTAPDPEKWRAHAPDIEPRLAAMAVVAGQAARAAGH
jgi:hypothetical protein